MGSTYWFLRPLWHRFPALDPGLVPDALGLANGSALRGDDPEDTAAILVDLEQAVTEALQPLLEAFPDQRAHLEVGHAELVAAIDRARPYLATARSA